MSGTSDVEMGVGPAAVPVADPPTPFATPPAPPLGPNPALPAVEGLPCLPPSPPANPPGPGRPPGAPNPVGGNPDCVSAPANPSRCKLMRPSETTPAKGWSAARAR